MRSTAALFLALLAAAPALAAYDESLPDPAQERRAVQLTREIRCPLCEAQSLEGSNAKIAIDLRALIRERVAAGDSDQQIKDFLVSRYGEFVLMEPPVRGGTAVLWFGPAVILLLGGAGVAAIVLRANRRAATEPAAEEIEPGA